jgi:DtxR family transcriptional regulator, Mn-dependent transcriptional regulator
MANGNVINLSSSLEDYLEAIFQIVREKQAARAKDISNRLNVGKSSVTGALQSLAQRELINYAPYDVITLTDKGKGIAEGLVRRHEVLRDFFVKVLAVDATDADATACKMEHAISDAILERFVEFVEFVERCPRGGNKWIKGFNYYCEHGNKQDNCEKCVELIQEDLRSKQMETQTDTGSTVTLGSLKPGDKATIVKITSQGSIRRRLLDMGATKGTVVEIERIAPLGDPIDVKIKGYHLSLRKEEAEHIQVQSL